MASFFLSLTNNINAQSTSDLLAQEVVLPSGHTRVLANALATSRNHVIIPFSWQCTTCLETLDLWKTKLLDWQNNYSVRFTLVDLSSAHKVEQSFKRYETTDYPFYYFIATNPPDSFVVADCLSHHFISKLGTERGIHRTRTHSGMEYVLRHLFRPNINEPILSNGISEAIFDGLRCDTASTQALNFSSDTTIRTKIYKKFTYRDEVYYLREDSSKLISLDLGKRVETTLANFGLNICDTFRINNKQDEEVWTIVEDKFVLHDRLHVQTTLPINICHGTGSDYLTFIEGVGTNAGMVYEVNHEEINSFLLCHSDMGVVNFRNTIFDGKCDVDFSSTTNQASEDIFLSLFPNPVDHVFHIEFNSDANLVVYNLAGQALLHSFLQANQPTLIDLSSFNAGIYMARVTSHQHTSTHPIIKK